MAWRIAPLSSECTSATEVRDETDATRPAIVSTCVGHRRLRPAVRSASQRRRPERASQSDTEPECSARASQWPSGGRGRGQRGGRGRRGRGGRGRAEGEGADEERRGLGRVVELERQVAVVAQPVETRRRRARGGRIVCATDSSPRPTRGEARGAPPTWAEERAMGGEVGGRAGQRGGEGGAGGAPRSERHTGGRSSSPHVLLEGVAELLADAREAAGGAERQRATISSRTGVSESRSPLRRCAACRPPRRARPPGVASAPPGRRRRRRQARRRAPQRPGVWWRATPPPTTPGRPPPRRRGRSSCRRSARGARRGAGSPRAARGRARSTRAPSSSGSRPPRGAAPPAPSRRGGTPPTGPSCRCRRSGRPRARVQHALDDVEVAGLLAVLRERRRAVVAREVDRGARVEQRARRAAVAEIPDVRADAPPCGWRQLKSAPDARSSRTTSALP